MGFCIPIGTFTIMSEVFTPIKNGIREEYNINDVKILSGKIARGNPDGTEVAEIEIKNKRYKAIQRSCSLENDCNCDIEIIEI